MEKCKTENQMTKVVCISSSVGCGKSLSLCFAFSFTCLFLFTFSLFFTPFLSSSCQLQTLSVAALPRPLHLLHLPTKAAG